eukprot:CAMPEP_0205936976 /NCGR_PEP_ID=MMETSP1325-20131115/42882_1 /ASSEMBLY_ACC=CAM_ASM_000708 /TAXON_ID=236786 /ORGANISM="Florenciella sp., Strain RCC1007" /LENGTH=53 /DNA_ID=CAMNT_0053307189 /DNA_START=9 /DNA_END=166 /DNA_ORIENTATION=-
MAMPAFEPVATALPLAQSNMTPFPHDELKPESEPFLLFTKRELVNVLVKRPDG